MKVSTFARAGVSVTAVAALSLGLCANASAAGPTAGEEDPAGTPAATTLVGVGSDTTQDVMYGIAKAINAGQATPVIASYTATGGTQITYRSGLTTARPNGSGAGYNALKDSIGLTAAGLAKPGDVDFARASGTQGAAATSSGAGVTTDVPFAVDTISVAVTDGSPFLKTNDGHGLSITDLANIYAGVDKYIDTTDGSLGTTAGGTNVPIHAFLPKPGSGSRQFFLQQLATQNPGGIPLGSNKGDSLFTAAGKPSAGAPYIGAVDAAGNPVQEHDATVLTSQAELPSANVASIAPFSGAKFIGYHNGVIDDPADKVAGTDYKLVPLKSTVTGAPTEGVLPYTVDDDGKFTPNDAYKTYATKGTESTSFKLFRDVYNIIPTAAWKNPGSNAKLQLINDTFVGKTSKVCQQADTIAAYGFLPASNCGDTSLTFDSPSTATATVDVTSPGVIGRSAVLRVSVQSNGNGGGAVALTVNGATYTATLDAGQTSASVTVPTPAAGSYSYSGSFTPNLPGVAASRISGSFTVVKLSPTVKATAPKAKHTKKAKVTVTVSAPGAVPTGKVTIVVKKGKKAVVTVKNKSLSHGRAAVTLKKKLPKGSYKVFVSYTGDAVVNAAPARSVATLKVK